MRFLYPQILWAWRRALAKDCLLPLKKWMADNYPDVSVFDFLDWVNEIHEC